MVTAKVALNVLTVPEESLPRHLVGRRPNVKYSEIGLRKSITTYSFDVHVDE
jgi:hypothetical protein